MSNGVSACSPASPPTDSSHQVAVAIAIHNRSARAGSPMRVCCHCQPPRLQRLKPCSIQALKPYQQASAHSGPGRSIPATGLYALRPSSPAVCNSIVTSCR